MFVSFLSDSYAILCRLKSELLEKHADAHASSMLATDNNNNLSESSHESQRSKTLLASLWNEYREQWRNTEKLKLARMDLKRLQTPQTQVIDTTRKASRCYYFLPLFWTILYDRYVPIYIITQVAFSHSRILIGSRLWSIGGQTHDWRHHYKVFPSAVLKWRKVLRIRIIFYMTGEKIRYKKVLPRQRTGSRSQKTKDKAVSFRKWYRNDFLAASVGSRARLNHAQTWSW